MFEAQELFVELDAFFLPKLADRSAFLYQAIAHLLGTRSMARHV